MACMVRCACISLHKWCANIVYRSTRFWFDMVQFLDKERLYLWLHTQSTWSPWVKFNRRCTKCSWYVCEAKYELGLINIVDFISGVLFFYFYSLFSFSISALLWNWFILDVWWLYWFFRDIKQLINDEPPKHHRIKRFCMYALYASCGCVRAYTSNEYKHIVFDGKWQVSEYVQ